jgi:hypothetical protein
VKFLQIVILFLFLLVAAGCGGDDPTATPFVIQDPDTGTDSEESAVEPPPPTDTPEPPTDTPESPAAEAELPTETPTSTPTPTATIIVATVPADETPLAPGIKVTPNISDPDWMATVGPILTQFPDLDLEDLDPNNLPQLPELPGGIELPDLPLPPLPGG